MASAGAHFQVLEPVNLKLRRTSRRLTHTVPAEKASAAKKNLKTGLI